MDLTSFPVEEFRAKGNFESNISIEKAEQVEKILKLYGIEVGLWIIMPEGPMSPRFPIRSENSEFLGYKVPRNEAVNLWWLLKINQSPFMVPESEAKNVAYLAKVLETETGRSWAIPELLRLANIVGETGQYRTVQEWLDAQPEICAARSAVWQRK